MTYGYDSSLWSYNNLDTFVSLWAQREFDLSVDDANDVSTIIGNLTRWNMRRKPELLNGTTYSLINYREFVLFSTLSLSTKPANLAWHYRAENVLLGWETLQNASTKIYNSLHSSCQASYFEMVQHPVLASATLGRMWIYQGLNNLRVTQARLSANALGQQVQTLFAQDYDLEHEYHTLLDGEFGKTVLFLFGN